MSNVGVPADQPAVFILDACEHCIALFCGSRADQKIGRLRARATFPAHEGVNGFGITRIQLRLSAYSLNDRRARRGEACLCGVYAPRAYASERSRLACATPTARPAMLTRPNSSAESACCKP